MAAESDAGEGASERAFADLVAALTDRPGVTHGGATTGRRFGADALKVDGKIFAMHVAGELVVKLPRARVEELIASGNGSPFGTGGRVMREWVSIPPSPGWEALASEALAFLGGRP